MLWWSRNDDQNRRHSALRESTDTISEAAESTSRTVGTPTPVSSHERHGRSTDPSGNTEEDLSRQSSNVVTEAHKFQYIRNLLNRDVMPFRPYTNAAAGYTDRTTVQYDPGGATRYQSVATGEFSAASSSDSVQTRYPGGEDVSRNTGAEWEDSELAHKTESVPETVLGSLPSDSGFDSVVEDLARSTTKRNYGGSVKRRSLKNRKRPFWVLMVFTGITFATASAFGLATFFYSHGELAPKYSAEGSEAGSFSGDQGGAPIVFHADGRLTPRSTKSTIDDAVEIAEAPRPKVFVNNAEDPAVNLDDGVQEPVVSDDSVQEKPTTRKVQRRKKIAVWEGKRIYEAGSEAPHLSSGVTIKPKEQSKATQIRLKLVSRQNTRAVSDRGAGANVNKADKGKPLKASRRASVTGPKRRPRAKVTLSGNNARFCETRVCERESVYLTSYLDWSVSPCDDFYKFVCNHWKSLHPDPASSVDSLRVRRVEEDIYNALTSQKKLSNKLIKAQSLVSACVHKPFTDNHRSALLDFMGDLGLRGWPFQRDTKTLTDVWKSASLLLRNLGLQVLVSVQVEPDPENEERYVIALGDPDLLIGQYGSKESQLPEWYGMAVTSCFKVFTSGKYVDIARRVREFSSRLAEAATDRGSEAFAAGRFQMVQLKHQSSLIQLLTFVFSNITVVHSRMKVLVKTEVFFRNLRTVLHVTKGMDVLNYLGFRALVHISPLLPDQAIEMAALQMKHLTGVRKTSWPRWRRCVRMFERVAPAVFLHAYAELRRDLPNKDKVWSLLNDIQASFVLAINSAPWMSIDDKLMLRDRLSHIKIEVFHKFMAKRGHKHAATEFMPVVEPGNVVTVYRSLARQLMERRLSKIQYRRDPSALQWKGSVFDTAPIFDRESGSIFVPMAMFDAAYMIDRESMLLQLPRVATKVIAALFAGIHHANFPPGKLTWSVDTKLGYHDVQKCLQRHYAAAAVDRIRTDKTTHFDVMDSMALLPAFKLFLKHVNQVNIEDYGLLTGLNITVKQLFYILYTKGMCETMDAARLKEQSEESLFHVPPERVNGALRNSFRFPTFWECASDSPMNPNQKCTIWTS